MAEPVRPPIEVVGLIGGISFGAEARAAINEATVVVGSNRQLAAARPGDASERIVLRGSIEPTLDLISQRRHDGDQVCILASGDPGFFGIVRLLADRFGVRALCVHPAPSAVSLAFARIGCNWDDATVVSAHGRPLDLAVEQVLSAPKAAVLTSPDSPPETVAAALVTAGGGGRHATVLSRIGEARESRFDGDLTAVARRTFDPMSVVIIGAPQPAESGKTLAWGLDDGAFAHRDGMITKAEVRAVALGKLALPRAGVLWDLGAGSGSVAIEAARLCPALRVTAVERDPESARRIAANAAAHHVTVAVVLGEAPAALDGLPDPDRVFIGGGGLEVLDAACTRLRPGGMVVASYALLDRAVIAWRRLGNLVDVAVSRGIATGAGGVRLRAENPVFVCWGPGQHAGGADPPV
jgi:precorrin-6B C5,15-methyltransferase / cobalt-precorrin-6B C5,C15-methyltransferase